MVEAYEYYQSFFQKGIANGGRPLLGCSGGRLRRRQDPDAHRRTVHDRLAREGGRCGLRDKFTTAVLPTKESSTSFSGGANLTVFKNSKNAHSAWKLAQWLTDPTTQAQWYEKTGDLPAVQAAWKDQALASQPTLAAFERSSSPPSRCRRRRPGCRSPPRATRCSRRCVWAPEPADAMKELQSKADALGMG
jgi:multiple sugar transport system substrate-binding protein